MTSKLWWVRSERYYERQRERQRKQQEKRMEKWKREATKAWSVRLPADPSSKLCFAKSVTRKPCDQATSSFFNVLPLEIREQIYSCATGGEELRCQVANETTTISGNDRPNETIPFKLICSGIRDVLGILSSCKRAHLEAIRHVYTRSTFQFSGTTSFWCFKRLMSDQNLASIQKLHLQYTYGAAYSSQDMIFGPAPWGRDHWQATCLEISRLKNLREVRLDFAFWSHGVDAAQEDIFFDALKCLPKGTRVDVRVPWPQRNAMRDSNVSPFKLTREVSFHEGNDGWFSLSDEEARQM